MIEAFSPPYIYLNHTVIKEKGLDLAEVQKAVAKEILDIDGKKGCGGNKSKGMVQDLRKVRVRCP